MSKKSEEVQLPRISIRSYALYKLTIMCMKDIWLFQAFGDEVYTNSDRFQ
ncbi:MAG: hypothetical protein HEQ10_12490 [Dolichospermum sp. DEX182a]|nr:hypothetical protein [Dolichospermum sp. DEX182a]